MTNTQGRGDGRRPPADSLSGGRLPVLSRMLIVVPLYNEAENVARVLQGVRQICPADILVVDDGSTDESVAAVRASGVCLPHLIQHARNGGYGLALLTGFDFARRHGYDAVLTFDADGQHDPRDIPSLLAAWAQGDIISGSRFHPDSPREGIAPEARLDANRRLTELVRQQTGYDITDSACGFKLYHIGALAQLQLAEPGYAMPYQVWGQAARAGLSVYEVPVTMIYRPHTRRPDVPPGQLEGTIAQCQDVLLDALRGNRWWGLIRRCYRSLLPRRITYSRIS